MPLLAQMGANKARAQQEGTSGRLDIVVLQKFWLCCTHSSFSCLLPLLYFVHLVLCLWHHCDVLRL